jgi:hypothetical protein
MLRPEAFPCQRKNPASRGRRRDRSGRQAGRPIGRPDGPLRLVPRPVALTSRRSTRAGGSGRSGVGAARAGSHPSGAPVRAAGRERKPWKTGENRISPVLNSGVHLGNPGSDRLWRNRPVAALETLVEERFEGLPDEFLIGRSQAPKIQRQHRMVVARELVATHSWAKVLLQGFGPLPGTQPIALEPETEGRDTVAGGALPSTGSLVGGAGWVDRDFGGVIGTAKREIGSIHVGPSPAEVRFLIRGGRPTAPRTLSLRMTSPRSIWPCQLPRRADAAAPPGAGSGAAAVAVASWILPSIQLWNLSGRT